jgi:O-antigen/teichoic acid export membrane protein
MGAIITVALLLFGSIYRFVDWTVVFNTSVLTSEALGRIVLVSVLCYGMWFMLNIISPVFFSIQKAALGDVLVTAGSTLSLLAIYVLVKTESPYSLFSVALISSAFPVLVFLGACIITFRGKHRYLSPSLKYVDMKCTKDLMGLGVNFFFIQIAVLILSGTANFIIVQLFTPTDVTIYNIAYKYFNFAVTGFAITLAPLWNAYTDAYVKNDFEWMKKTIKQMMIFWFICLLGTLLLIVLSPLAYRLWVGEKVAETIPISLSIACAVYVSIVNWSSLFTYFVNGVGKIRLQLYGTCSAVFVYIPLAIFLGKMLGIQGVVYASCAALLINGIFLSIQCRKIIKQTASGIWNK